MICRGCGFKMQSVDSTRPGYVAQNLLEKKTQYCKRCFDLMHYNQEDSLQKNNDVLFSILKQLDNQTDVLYVYVYDPILEVSFPDELITFLKSKDVFLVATKYDLLKEQYSKQNIEEYIRKYVSKFSFRLQGNVVLSSFQKDDIRSFYQALQPFQKKKIYVIGATNVGKSTLLNQMMELFLRGAPRIATSYRVATTLDALEIKFSDDFTLYDTPGYIDKKSFPYFLKKESLLKTQVKNKIRPKIYQLKEGQTIFVDGMLRVDFISGPDNSFVFYGSDYLHVHRTKLENADDFFMKHQFGLLSIPHKEEAKELGSFKGYEMRFVDQKRIEIVLAGIGYMSFLGDCVLKIHTYEAIRFHIRKDWL